MHTPGPVAAGGFFCEQGLPDEYYAFCGGELSLTVERGGGINTLHVLDILECGGKQYPDRCATPPVIRREGSQCGKRPVYGPGIQFISTLAGQGRRPGRNLFHVPDRMELYPCGFRSESERFGQRLGYDLAIEGRSVLFRFRNSFPTRDRLILSLNRDHLLSGQVGSLKNQLLDWWVAEELRHLAPDPANPFPGTRGMKLTWSFIGHDPATGLFLIEGEMEFAYGRKPVVVALTGSRPMTLTENKCRHFLAFPWQRDSAEDELRLCLVVASSRAEACTRVVGLTRDTDAILERLFRAAVDYGRRGPRLEIEGVPAATEFARTIPAFERAMVLAETESEACIRAAMHKFGYFAMWDHIYPVKAFLTFGDYALAEKLIRYMLTLPRVEPLLWITVHLLVQTEETVGITGNLGFLREAFPTLKRFFGVAAGYADPRTGLLALDNSSGVDDPKEIGIVGTVWPSCINGWWFSGCRATENLARLLGDAETAASAHEVAARIERHFLPVFFDPDRGYLHAVVDPVTGRGTGVYQNVATLGMDYPYGEFLMRGAVRDIAEYQAAVLCHPAGRSAVAYDDLAHEMWKHVIMFQHLAHEAKTARAAGLGDEALRLVQTYLRIFDRCKVGIETHNLCGADGDISQRANWQAFGASSALGALVGGVLGVQADLGGFGYAPCDLDRCMRIDGFRFRDSCWDIRICGCGPGVDRFELDGEHLPGTSRVPADRLTGGAHTLRIVRGSQVPDRPLLISAAGAAVCGLASGPGWLRFRVAAPVHTPLKIRMPTAAGSVTAGGTALAAAWDAASGTLWCDALLLPDQTVEVRFA